MTTIIRWVDFDVKAAPSLPAASSSTSAGLTAVQPVSYRHAIKPLIDNRCVVCHACYDAPCQLKLGSSEGIQRGASKETVYNGDRLKPAQPTRLFVDAQTTAEWRRKAFFPVIAESNNDDEDRLKLSVLAQMLQLKKAQPSVSQGKLPKSYEFELNRELQCPKSDEFSEFAQNHPDWGMPYALPALNSKQHNLIETWLQQGAPIEKPLPIKASTLHDIYQWERFLNADSLKEQLTARYLYEHLFLGHLHFKGSTDDEFFTLVRSHTPINGPIDEIVTDLPYQNPNVKRVFYRFKPVRETIVDKTHFVYELSNERMQRYRELFFTPDYKVDSLPPYTEARATNPFETFAAIPPDTRYRFLLDEAAYFIGGFIKGPVCRGQVALNVIQDRFWVMFVSPDLNYADIGAKFLATHSEQLSLPAAEGKDIGALGWYEYDMLGQKYLQVKNNFIAKLMQTRNIGLNENDIWNGDHKNPNAALTIFRHNDSATVVKGFIGDFPKTAWVVDYPLLERLHYLLVAGFNVYGTVWHQLATRKYMDYLRIDGENNFLRFMPRQQRMPIHDEWYVGILPEISELTTKPLFNINQESGVNYRTNAYKQEFLLKVLSRLGNAAQQEDVINRCTKPICSKPASNSTQHRIENSLRRLAKLKGKLLSVLPETSFLRIRTNNTNNDKVYTLLVDKDLKNLSTLFAEELRHIPEKDRLTVVPEFLGSYPNYFFQVPQQQLDKFINNLATISDDDDRERFYSTYGVRRSNPGFWQQSDFFNQRYRQNTGIESGLFDLNRYDNL
jgi:hypothetical protein